MPGVSDMVNPTREKDAAVAWARKRDGPLAPSGNRWRCPAHASGRPAHSGNLTPNRTTKCSGRSGIPDGHGRAAIPDGFQPTGRAWLLGAASGARHLNKARTRSVA